MPLPIGFDMDGVLADFDLAFHEVQERLFGPGAVSSAGEPEKEEEAQIAGPCQGSWRSSAANAWCNLIHTRQGFQLLDDRRFPRPQRMPQIPILL
jgi:FMN phosphatase YigB (HAD superfamily)